MNIKQLVETVKKAEPSLKGLPDEDAHKLLARTFKSIIEEISATKEGTVRVAKLGRFSVRVGERERKGRKVQVQRVMFRPAKAEKA